MGGRCSAPIPFLQDLWWQKKGHSQYENPHDCMILLLGRVHEPCWPATPAHTNGHTWLCRWTQPWVGRRLQRRPGPGRGTCWTSSASTPAAGRTKWSLRPLILRQGRCWWRPYRAPSRATMLSRSECAVLLLYDQLRQAVGLNSFQDDLAER